MSDQMSESPWGGKVPSHHATASVWMPPGSGSPPPPPNKKACSDAEKGFARLTLSLWSWPWCVCVCVRERVCVHTRVLG